jgi:hypothetical protein
MAFSLSGFGSGLAKGGASYFEQRAKDKGEDEDFMRNLIFKTNSITYDGAEEAKKKRAEQNRIDNQYRSLIRSMDPNISKDNESKLLSLGAAKRDQAVSEYEFRMVSNPNVTFGDFMSYVDQPEDLDDPTKLDRAAQESLIQPSRGAKAFYSKTDLLSDIDTTSIYNNISSAMTEAYGYSIAQAKQIANQALNDITYPPIRIAWSESIVVKQYQIENRVLETAYRITNNESALVQLTNRRIIQSNSVVDGLRDAFANNYSMPVRDEDGELVKNEYGIVQTERVPSVHALLDPEFGARFKTSQGYLAVAMESMTAPIIAMQEDPAANKTQSMNYMNSVFPGVYGGEIDLSTGNPQDVLDTLVMNKVYYVKAKNPDGTENPEGTVATGVQIKMMIEDELGLTSTGDSTVGDEDIFAEDVVTSAQAALDVALDLGETGKRVKNLQIYAEQTAGRASALDYFNNLEAAPTMGDAQKMQDAVFEIANRSDGDDMRAALAKLESMSIEGAPMLVSSAIERSMTILQLSLDDLAYPKVKDIMGTISATIAEGKANKTYIKGSIRKLNKLLEDTRNEEHPKIEKLKDTLYSLLQD